MMRIKKVPLVIGMIVVTMGVGAVVVRVSQRRHLAHEHVVYYCPMHPTYTSDRPGDCPICSMKLVKREGSPQSTVHSPQLQKTWKDICYLHNCPKAHEGKPCPMLVVAKEGESVTCPICGMHVVEAATAPTAKRIRYWTDPMIPGYRSDKPGKSPMGMDLVPVYEEATEGSIATATAPPGYAPILVTPQKQQLIGVKTSRVVRKKLTKTIRAVGTIAHDPELYQAQAEYIQAIQALERAKQGAGSEGIEQAQRLVASSQIRLKHLGLNDDLIQEIATWKEPEHSLLFAHPGEPVWMYAKVYEYELPLVRVGQELVVEVPSLPGETFHGLIRAIDPMVDPMTRTTRIRAQLQQDQQGRLKPETYVNVSIAVDLGEVLAIPDTAVFQTGTKPVVFVDKGEGLFEPRDVVLGAKADGDDEVISGVAEGETVVTSGNFLIDSESRLKAALEGMSGGEHQHGQ